MISRLAPTRIPVFTGWRPLEYRRAVRPLSIERERRHVLAWSGSSEGHGLGLGLGLGSGSGSGPGLGPGPGLGSGVGVRVRAKVSVSVRGEGGRRVGKRRGYVLARRQVLDEQHDRQPPVVAVTVEQAAAAARHLAPAVGGGHDARDEPRVGPCARAVTGWRPCGCRPGCMAAGRGVWLQAGLRGRTPGRAGLQAGLRDCRPGCRVAGRVAGLHTRLRGCSSGCSVAGRARAW